MKAVGFESTTYGLKDSSCGNINTSKFSVSDETANRFAGDLLATLQNAPELLRIVEAWPSLPEPIRRAIVSLANASEAQKS